jgi:hypothetical protein
MGTTARIPKHHPAALLTSRNPGREYMKVLTFGSVPGPNPDPDELDPHVFGPLGSGSPSHRYGSGSGGSFYHQAKIVRKTLIPNVFF